MVNVVELFVGIVYSEVMDKGDYYFVVIIFLLVVVIYGGGIGLFI